MSWQRILYYHYDKSYIDDDDDYDEDDDNDNNIDNCHYYQGDELGCSPVLFCSVILKILSTELYKCNQFLKAVLPLHLDDIGPFLLWSSYSNFGIQEYSLWQMLLMLYVTIFKCLEWFSQLSSNRGEFHIPIWLLLSESKCVSIIYLCWPLTFYYIYVTEFEGSKCCILLWMVHCK